MTQSKCIFSVDVEDWFHILDLPATPKLPEWDNLPSFVEKNFLELLDILSENGIRATCFFLGWVAEKYPDLVKAAAENGHEIASHGYAHELVYQLTPGEFREDAARSKKILEDITGTAVSGYRASGFSVTEENTWYFDTLIQCGYRYDSSVFPAPRGHGGMKTDRFAPHVLKSEKGSIIEFPITVAPVFNKPFCFFGGGYFRLFPYFLIKRKTNAVLEEGRPVIFYIHPREIDPDHPRLPMNFKRQFKSYINLKYTREKIRRLGDDFQFTTFEDYIADREDLQEV